MCCTFRFAVGRENGEEALGIHGELQEFVQVRLRASAAGSGQGSLDQMSFSKFTRKT